MAISQKVINEVFGDMVKQVSKDPEASLKAVRKCLVAYERLELTADEVLTKIDAALDGFGVECIRDEQDSNNIIAEYVNMGETYEPTILYSYRTNRFYACSWGDWYEASPEYKEYSRKQYKLGF